MSDGIDPRDGPAHSQNDNESLEDRFLIDEGLDLLSAFRSIRDPAVRQQLMADVIRAAACHNS